MDRFLMYYIRTAGPLVRTATWLEKLDGGLDYLKEVIIRPYWYLWNIRIRNGSAYWNIWMRMETSTWKPRLMQRFSHSVNSDDKDDNIEYVPVRDQKNEILNF
jgi:nitrite reductase (NADH) large subunit